jgi:hypothetical protein
MSYSLYEYLKREWIESHPSATPEQYQRAIRAIAKRLGI